MSVNAQKASGLPKKSLRIHLHTREMLTMLNYGTVSVIMQFPYEIRHKLVELFGAQTILIVVYGI